MIKKYSKLILINLLIFLSFFIIGLAVLEFVSSINKSKVQNPGLIFDDALGWETNSPILPINVSKDKAKKIAFIGDSFTHGKPWASLTVKSLNNTIKTEGYSLGVSGYSTLQSFIKLKKYFEEINPDLVILLFYSWNDMRDNYNMPGISYSPNTELRPYLDETNQVVDNFLIPKKNWFRDLEIYRKYVVLYKLKINKLITKIFGIDQISAMGLKINLNYTNEDSWIPFYLEEKENSHYVKSSWKATESILSNLNNFVKGNGKELIIIGIDNAFTVDDDVKEAWVDGIENFDIYKNIVQLKKICKKNKIFFIDGLSKLKEKKKTMDKKIYNYPVGNLSGHLEIEGHQAISEAVVEFINEKKILK